MKIVNAGVNYRHSEKLVINRPCGSGDYILLVVKSPAFFMFSGHKTVSDKNAVMLFKKGTPQYYGAYGGEFANDWIHFELSPLEEAEITELGIPFDTVLYPSTVSEISGFISDIFSERYSGNKNKDRTMELYFKLILMKLSDGISQRNELYGKPFFNELSKLRCDITSSPEKARNIDGICKDLGMSRSYLQHLYKEYFVTSIVEDIKNCRMEHAKYLLSGTDMTVSAIAAECGYASDVHFMRIFKKTVGVSPTEYRKSNAVLKNELDSGRKLNPFCL